MGMRAVVWSYSLMLVVKPSTCSQHTHMRRIRRIVEYRRSVLTSHVSYHSSSIIAHTPRITSLTPHPPSTNQTPRPQSKQPPNRTPSTPPRNHTTAQHSIPPHSTAYHSTQITHHATPPSQQATSPTSSPSCKGRACACVHWCSAGSFVHLPTCSCAEV